MGVWLDDAFYEHPKFVAAGGDATLLWVCALAYARRYHTEGVVPAGIVARLTDRKSPDRLARRLVDVGLWELNGDNNYIFHDYDDWNRSDVERSAKASRAASIRWGSRKQPDDAMRSHPPSIASAHADAHADAHAPAMLGDASPSPSPRGLNPSPSPRSTHDGDGEPVENDLVINNGTGTTPTGTTPKSPGQGTHPGSELLARLVKACTGRDRGRVNIEAVQVLAWAKPRVSDQVVDEAIGYCAAAAKPPVFPSAIAKVIGLRAHDAGVDMPPFVRL